MAGHSATALIGAIDTQSSIEPAYGPRGLLLMRSGIPRADEARDVRQFALTAGAGRCDGTPLLAPADDGR